MALLLTIKCFQIEVLDLKFRILVVVVLDVVSIIMNAPQ